MRRQFVGPEYMHVSFAEKEKKAAGVDAKKSTANNAQFRDDTLSFQLMR